MLDITTLYYYSWVIVFFPLFGSILIFLNLSFWSTTKVQKIAMFSIFCSLVFSILLLYNLISFGPLQINLNFGVWFSASTSIEWGFLIDELSICMFFIVSFISFVVYLFSIDYMRLDPNINRFFSYLLLFSFFMLILVSANNFVQLFIGWEGVGLCSFLLISFWSTRLAANKAGIKAMVINRIGDNFILWAICLLIQTCGTTNFFNLFFNNFFLEGNSIYSVSWQSYSIFGWNVDLLSFIGFVSFLGIMAKSAQFGFHTWLPDAMEGPTPVSALIHAATMVTAGVFLFLRLSNLYIYLNNLLIFIVIIGILTTLFAGTVALVQNDIKKVIAYSTCSQLGYMITACGLGFYSGAFFHLICHALFKALLFLGAGSIIHTLSDEQDIRRMGGLAWSIPITFFTFFLASANLMGFPFTSGFYSKDLLLEMFFSHTTAIGFFAYFWAIIGAVMTILYSLRLFYLVFFSGIKSYKYSVINFHVNTPYILTSLVILAISSIWFGKLFQQSFLYFFSSNTFATHELLIPLGVKILPFFLFICLFYSYFYWSKNLLPLNSQIYTFLSYKWYIDVLTNRLITHKFYILGFKFFYLKIEKGWIEFFGPTGILSSLSTYGKVIFFMQQNKFHSFLTFTLTLLLLTLLL